MSSFPEIGITGSDVVATLEGNIYTGWQDTITEGKSGTLVSRTPLIPSTSQ
jgi:hypothetical protein